MAKKKSEIYGALWDACNKLRGGMDASQYKDYVLTLLFVKYISDKAKADANFLVDVPEGASFDDMVKFKGKSNIGELINKEILAKIAEANENLLGLIDKVDFDDTQKLGNGKEQVDRLTKLIAVFERDEIDFSKNNAEGDDLLGDAYEYLMGKFAAESGKSKGQFYTPAEVSRIMAKVIGADRISTASTTIYDPTCGSGSLLLKVAYEAQTEVSIYGQEKDNATVGLAIMNMYLHNNELAEIKQGNTIASPQYKDNDTTLTTFDFVVANPPFSDKEWSMGITPSEDSFSRFALGVPPEKNGDYAYLLHLLKSMKQTGKGAIILPHGVLFRGNAEADIRKALIEKRWIKGIISLPSNLFYGTGIPACIIVLDKADAETRQGIFMIDASKDFIKDGNKNRLRECDIKKIVDTFNNMKEIPKYSRFVPISEISEKNEYNLNIPRYIDTQEAEDIQDINAHLNGGIPNFNIEELDKYWQAFPSAKLDLFAEYTDGYSKLLPDLEQIKPTIINSSDFVSYKDNYNSVFKAWAEENKSTLWNIPLNTKPKKFIADLGETVLTKYEPDKLTDKYAVYQLLMEYWQETMQDDVYIISEIGYKIELQEHRETKNKKEIITYYNDLVPAPLVEKRYFPEDLKQIQEKENELSNTQSQKEEFLEENCSDEGKLNGLTLTYKKNIKGVNQEVTEDLYDGDSMSKGKVEKFITANKNNLVFTEEILLLRKYLEILAKEAKLNKEIKEIKIGLYNKVLKKYAGLTVDEIKTLVVDDKWLATLKDKFEEHLNDLTQVLSKRVKEVSRRYESTVSELEDKRETLKTKVKAHLATMGY